MKYLGMLVDEKKLTMSQWVPVEEKFAKKYLDGREICFQLGIELLR
jgi:hypothetical protein